MTKERCPHCTYDVEMMEFTVRACPTCRIASLQEPTVPQHWVKEMSYILRHLPEWEVEQCLVDGLKELGWEVIDD